MVFLWWYRGSDGDHRLRRADTMSSHRPATKLFYVLSLPAMPSSSQFADIFFRQGHAVQLISVHARCLLKVPVRRTPAEQNRDRCYSGVCVCYGRHKKTIFLGLPQLRRQPFLPLLPLAQFNMQTQFCSCLCGPALWARTSLPLFSMPTTKITPKITVLTPACPVLPQQ